MKLLDVVKTVGSSVVREVVPGGGLLIEAVNAWLPDDEKLPSNATGQDIDRAAGTLAPEQQAKLLAKEFDVSIARIQQGNETVRAMLDADAKMPHTTRPRIALGAFYVVAFAVVIAVSAWAYGVISEAPPVVEAVTAGWPFVLSVIGPLVTLLWAYFGVLKTEHKNRLDAAAGRHSTPSGLSGIIRGIARAGGENGGT